MPSNITTFHLKAATCFGRISTQGAAVRSLIVRTTLSPRFQHPSKMSCRKIRDYARFGVSRRSIDGNLSFMGYTHECLPYQSVSHPRRFEFLLTRLDTYIKKRSRTNVIVFEFIVSSMVLYPA